MIKSPPPPQKKNQHGLINNMPIYIDVLAAARQVLFGWRAKQSKFNGKRVLSIFIVLQTLSFKNGENVRGKI